MSTHDRPTRHTPPGPVPVGGRPASRGFRTAALLAICLLGPSAPALGGVTWDLVEPVDQPVDEVSSTSGASARYVDGVWHVVYTRDGQVRHRARGDDGWETIETVSTAPGTARDPHLAWDGNALYVAWEDDRTGIAEVWVRTRAGGNWSSETCLSEDEVPSRAPVIAANQERVLVAWEEAAAPSRIMGRFHSGYWETPVTISGGDGSASEPTVSMVEEGSGPLGVAWADTRHGATEIYLRTWEGSWQPEVRVTDLPGECGHPSLQGESCCGDAIQAHFILTYEHTAPGSVAEIWTSCGPPGGMGAERISPDDGIPSILPVSASFPFVFGWFLGGAFPRPFVAWTDVRDHHNHELQEGSYCPWYTNPIEPLSEGGLSHAAVAAAGGSPDAHVLVLWIEEVADVPTLLSRQGVVPGCTAPDPQAPPALLLAPSGVPADTLVMLDECSHEPIAGQAFSLSFSPALAQELTWDPLQPHPTVSVTTNAQGEAVFSLRGGGCSQAGTVTASFDDYGLPVEFTTWLGARSPDVDGDCMVRAEDRAAVIAALGTGDFCADLDGSGLVDSADVAIVDSALGTVCSHLVGTPQSPPRAVRPRLTVDPNPCRSRARLDLQGAPSAVRVRVFDVCGRQVRDLTMPPRPGGSLRTEWDTRDDLGRIVPSGMYTVSASGPGLEARQSVLVLR